MSETCVCLVTSCLVVSASAQSNLIGKDRQTGAVNCSQGVEGFLKVDVSQSGPQV